jgi:hypothetical protein
MVRTHSSRISHIYFKPFPEEIPIEESCVVCEVYFLIKGKFKNELYFLLRNMKYCHIFIYTIVFYYWADFYAYLSLNIMFLLFKSG